MSSWKSLCILQGTKNPITDTHATVDNFKGCKKQQATRRVSSCFPEYFFEFKFELIFDFSAGGRSIRPSQPRPSGCSRAIGLPTSVVKQGARKSLRILLKSFNIPFPQKNICRKCRMDDFFLSFLR